MFTKIIIKSDLMIVMLHNSLFLGMSKFSIIETVCVGKHQSSPSQASAAFCKCDSI